MALKEDDASVVSAANKYRISERGALGLLYRDIWGSREKLMGDPWSPSNPNGVVILRLAENSLMHQEIGAFVKQHVVSVHPTNHLTYSTGPRGSHRLRRAAAAFWTDEFKPVLPIGIENLFITPGLASAIDALAWSICDEGEAILIPQPFYNGFSFDLANRSNVQVLPVSYAGIEGYSTIDDLFDPQVNQRAVERAIQQAKMDGVCVKALMISHPHNPLGRCYPPETLEVFASFCGEHYLHFISDEIYAHSVFQNPELPDVAPFVSTLSLDLHKAIDPSRHQVLYGASKDFCANGLRLGFIYSRNDGIMGALSSISMFSWSPHLIQDIWAAMLEDKIWLKDFMDKKRSLMLENYHVATEFFREHGIQFHKPNAGLYLWIDLRHLLATSQPDHPVTHDPSIQSPDTSRLKEREIVLADACARHGVLIAPGHIYMAEQYGWFRVTFTVRKDALIVGLCRLWRTLQEFR